MKKQLFIIAIIAAVASLYGCKDYMDINYDPNSPASENLTSDMIIPAAEMNIAASYAYTLHVLGAYNVQYYAQQFGTPNYVAYSQFNVSATNGSNVYTQLFQRALGNLETARTKATEAGENGVYLQATVLRAYAFQLLVDAFGEVPYSEAFDVNNPSPKYESGETIYRGIIGELDNALAKVSAGDQVATSYIFPSKSVDEWIGFANALKLKMLSRMSNVQDVSADIRKIIEGGNLPTEDIEISGCWSNSSGQANPFYSEEKATWGRATHNIIGNVALIGTMKQESYTDPRLSAWFEPNASNEYQGSISGTNLSTVEDKYKSTSAWCETKYAYNTPVILMAQTEVEFFLAEYYARQGDGSNAAQHYEAAIAASFATAGVSGAEEHITKHPYNQGQWKEVIGLAKWVALAGINGFEGYTEARRLDYPQFGTIKGSDMYAGTGTLDLTKYVPGYLYTPFQRFDQVGDNRLLERFPYPESSTARNSNSPVFPGYLEPVFWGK